MAHLSSLPVVDGDLGIARRMLAGERTVALVLGDSLVGARNRFIQPLLKYLPLPKITGFTAGCTHAVTGRTPQTPPVFFSDSFFNVGAFATRDAATYAKYVTVKDNYSGIIFNGNTSGAAQTMRYVQFYDSATSFYVTSDSLYHAGEWRAAAKARGVGMDFSGVFYRDSNGAATAGFLTLYNGSTDLTTSDNFSTNNATADYAKITMSAASANVDQTLGIRLRFPASTATVNGTHCIPAAFSVDTGESDGFHLFNMAVGGYSVGTYLDSATFDPLVWSMLPLIAGGVTDVIIQLDQNSSSDEATHYDNLSDLLDLIRAQVPNCRVHMISSYDTGSKPSAGQGAAVRQVALDYGGIYLNVNRLLGPNSVLDNDFDATWVSGRSYLAGDIVLVSSTYYVAKVDVTTSLTTSPAADATRWQSLTVSATNALDLPSVPASYGGIISSDGIHESRMGYHALAQGWAHAYMAAAAAARRRRPYFNGAIA